MKRKRREIKEPQYETPSKTNHHKAIQTTLPVIHNADRSARRKSTRNLIDRTITGDLSDDNDLEEDNLTKQIWEEDEQEEEEEEDEDPDEDGNGGNGQSLNLTSNTPADHLPTIPDTPSKRPRGRPKGAQRKQRTPTPPPDLPPHERYFFQNRPSNTKTSSNTLSTLKLLNHSTYHTSTTSHTDPHASSLAFLQTHHGASFPLWTQTLHSSYSLCLYGYGSKRSLLLSYANHLHSTLPSPPTTIIINGAHPTITPRQILTTILSALPNPPPPTQKLPSDLLPFLFTHLSTHPTSTPIYLLLSSLDAPPLRHPSTQSLLATLASHAAIHLVATADTPNFPLLWDVAMRDRFNWVFQDATTFASYDDGQGTGEAGGVVDAVQELFGKKGGGGQGREGVRWVLGSLPENARGLYRVLVAELLAMDEGGEEDDEEDGEDGGLGEGSDEEGEGNVGRRRARKRGEFQGVEYKALYQKAVEEFLCSSEMAFRSLLKEFVDHRMVVVKREAGGAEVLGVEMGRQELEGVLEDLMG